MKLIGLMMTALLGIGALFGCAGPKPYAEYSQAYIALKSARSSEASRYSPGYWSKAERLYREGEQAYKQNENEKAKVLFGQAQKYAEKAENVTRLRKFKTGGAP